VKLSGVFARRGSNCRRHNLGPIGVNRNSIRRRGDALKKEQKIPVKKSKFRIWAWT